MYVDDSIIRAGQVNEQRSLAEAVADLLSAADLPALAERLHRRADALGFGACVVGLACADGEHWLPQAGEAERQLLHAPVTAPLQVDAGGRVLMRCDASDARLVFAAKPPADGWAPEPFRRLLAGLLDGLQQRLQLADGIRRAAHAEKLQAALFAIADMAGSDMEMTDMLREMHAIVGRFMYAENFYIALHDAEQDALRFLYLVDTVDDIVRDPAVPVPMSEMERGLTWYLVRHGQPLMGSLEQIRARLPGPLRGIGVDCLDWLGVPIVSGGVVRGVLVVQSYVERPRYTEADQALLSYVGTHILTALDRKQAHEELERHVVERTRELTLEVQERQRSERLQQTLYRIAELSQSADDLDAFYRAVHGIVGEFMDVSNFYIAVLGEDGESLEFPYVVDQHGDRPAPRRLGRGITEYVLRIGRPLLVDMSDPPTRDHIESLLASGELVVHGTISSVWIGVPLVCRDRTVGVLAVQSYDEGFHFTDRDRELLTFISYQIANGLERQRAAAALRLANSELEARVHERTRELSEQIRVREAIEEQLKHQVLHDALTGLPNRAYLRDYLGRCLARSRRDANHRFAVLFVDLDRFKVINDSVGHLVGDRLLQEVARRFGDCVRTGPDMVARLGGDEFAILMDDIRGSEDALRMAHRVIDALRAPVRVDGKDLFTGASVGIAISAPHYRTPEELLRDADIAMYRAKRDSERHVEVFDERLHAQALQLLDVESDLRRAAVRDEFEPYFQPIVRLCDLSVVGYEALIRWNHPRRGVLAPGAFLHVAEVSGILETIDWWMFERSLQVVPQLLAPGQYVNLNCSPRHFRGGDFDKRLLRLIEAAGVLPEQVRLEVTEGTLMDNPERIGVIFERLRRAGVLIALDDFGTGYSSLSYLHRFRLQTLKIDRSFVGDLTTSGQGNSEAVVRAIMALSQAQALEVVAEGIETEAQREAVRSLGCELGQGYLFAKPQSLSALLAARQRQHPLARA